MSNCATKPNEKKSAARPQKKGVSNVIFSVVISNTVFDALDTASPDFEMSWRQLAQKAIRDFASTLPESVAEDSETIAA